MRKIDFVRTRHKKMEREKLEQTETKGRQVMFNYLKDKPTEGASTKLKVK